MTLQDKMMLKRIAVCIAFFSYGVGKIALERPSYAKVEWKIVKFEATPRFFYESRCL